MDEYQDSNRLQDELKAATIDNKWAGKDKQELEKRIKSLEKEIEKELEERGK